MSYILWELLLSLIYQTLIVLKFNFRLTGNNKPVKQLIFSFYRAF